MELKRINLHRISEILSEKELKDVLGGSGSDGFSTCFQCYNGHMGNCCKVSGDCIDYMADKCPAGYTSWECWCF